MKCRLGYVSNSSSSSFILPKKNLSEDQIKFLFDLCDDPKGVGEWRDGWSLNDFPDTISGFTVMNNGCCEGDGGLFDILKANGFPMSEIHWEDD